MSALWTSEELAAATLGNVSAKFSVNGISIDTRTLKPGDLFIALTGDMRDGHEFLAAAQKAGAAAALVSRDPGTASGLPLLTVANTMRGLEDIGRAARARSFAKTVGVTGSAGKTTTKEMLRLALGALGRTHCSSGSYNNHWGVPLSLALTPRDAQFAVYEIGMNHFGEIRQLVSFARPHVAMVTTIAPAHLEFFGSCEAIADAKSEIFEGLVPGGAAVLPADNPYVERLAARARQVGITNMLTFGEAVGSDARLIAMDDQGEGMKVEAEILGKPCHFRIGAPGAHIAMNALGALLSVSVLDGDVLNAAAALSDFAALKGRGARFTVANNSIEVIDESYNANPASMRAALALLGSAKAKRRIAILGDMLEMGPEGPQHHAGLADAIEAAKVDLVFLNGVQMKSLWEALPASRRGAWGETSKDIAQHLSAALRQGDAVLVKGSLGSKMAVIVDALKAHVIAA